MLDSRMKALIERHVKAVRKVAPGCGCSVCATMAFCFGEEWSCERCGYRGAPNLIHVDNEIAPNCPLCWGGGDPNAPIFELVQALLTPRAKPPRRGLTKNGVIIHYENPQLTRIMESDLLFHSANELRYNNVVPVSVLFHLALCVELARTAGYSTRLQAIVAVHDLAECYLKELPGGLKDCLPDYRALEALWEEYLATVLRTPWPLTPEEHRALKLIDHRSLLTEMTLFEHQRLEKASVEYQDERRGPATTIELHIGQQIRDMSIRQRWSIVWGAIQAYHQQEHGTELVLH